MFNECVSKRLTGIDSYESYLLLLKSIFKSTKSEKVLAVGSGLANTEQILIEKDVVSGSIDAYELSDVAVKKANHRIYETGLSDRIKVRCGDVLKFGISHNI